LIDFAGDRRRVHLEERLLDRLGELQALLDAVEAGRDHRREGEVRVRGRVRAADLEARALDRLAGETIGTRMSAERFVRPQVRYVGAS
jgi:hypothetical protein